jgi:CDP-glucose 4,6-dehydratase
VQALCARWGNDASYELDKGSHPHEANYLKLDCSKAKTELGWHPRWGLDKALESIVAWSLAYRDGKELSKVCLKQIRDYSTQSC